MIDTIQIGPSHSCANGDCESLQREVLYLGGPVAGSGAGSRGGRRDRAGTGPGTATGEGRGSGGDEPGRRRPDNRGLDPGDRRRSRKQGTVGRHVRRCSGPQETRRCRRHPESRRRRAADPGGSSRQASRCDGGLRGRCHGVWRVRCGSLAGGGQRTGGLAGISGGATGHGRNQAQGCQPAQEHTSP